MRQTKVTAMVEAGVMSAVAIVFALISAYIPFIGPLVNFIWPVPFVLLGVRHGYRWSIMATVVAGIIITILVGPLRAVSVVIGYGLIGIALGHCFRAEYGYGKSFLWGTAATLVSTLARLGIFFIVMGVNPLTLQLGAMDQAVEQTMALYRNYGMSEQQLAQMTETMETSLKLIKIMVPTLLAGGAVIETFIIFVVARRILAKLGYTVESFPPFKRWTMPTAVLYIFILGMGMVFLGKTEQLDWVYNLGENLRWVGILFTLIQGLALFYFLADKYNLSRMVRGIILLLIFVNPLFTWIVIFGGAYDIAMDYRRLRQPRSS